MSVKLPGFVPKAPDVIREALIVLAGAMIAAAVVRGLPEQFQRYFSWPGSKD